MNEPRIDFSTLSSLYALNFPKNWTEQFISKFIGEDDWNIDMEWVSSFLRNLLLFEPDIVAVRYPLLGILYSNGTRPPALAVSHLLADQSIYNRHILRFDPQTQEFFALYWPQITSAPEIELIYQVTPAERFEMLESSVMKDTGLVAILRHAIDINPQMNKVLRHARHARIKEVAPNELRLRLLDECSGRKVSVGIKREGPSQNYYWPSLTFEDYVN